nr:sigma factor [Treponema sp. OMZ 803]
MSQKYQNKNIPIMDLISEGNIGLMNAADRFDPDKVQVYFVCGMVDLPSIKSYLRKISHDRLPLNRANELVQIEKPARL